MNGAPATLLSILTIGSFLLAAGGVYLAGTGRDRKKGVLMIVAAAVLLGNVLILAA
ncbi:MAG TPA: hypothetical protein VGB79_05305 [Allosphingosinicella sp.]|jgi:hypothetical protein